MTNTERHRRWLNKPGNKERVRDYARERYRSDAAYRAQLEDCRLRRTFGITLEEYGALLVAQGGVCKICGGHARKRSKYPEHVGLHVDHDHNTKRVRGLLCDKCNQGIGCFRDVPALLRAAADYLS
jgi:hypothetical protein